MPGPPDARVKSVWKPFVPNIHGHVRKPAVVRRLRADSVLNLQTAEKGSFHEAILHRLLLQSQSGFRVFIIIVPAGAASNDYFTRD